DLAGPLDDRAVHDGVGVRQFDLDHVDAGLDHRADRGDAALDRREPGRHAAEQHAPAVGAGLIEGRRQAHRRSSSRPKYDPAVSTSLSPRPDRLTRTIAPGSSEGAIRRAPASACALSMAGMIPSVRHSRWKAVIASASVTGWYSARPTSDSQECSGPTPG